MILTTTNMSTTENLHLVSIATPRLTYVPGTLPGVRDAHEMGYVSDDDGKLPSPRLFSEETKKSRQAANRFSPSCR